MPLRRKNWWSAISRRSAAWCMCVWSANDCDGCSIPRTFVSRFWPVFSVRMALGQYDLEQPEDLLKLLAVMARNKVVNKARRMDVNGQGGERVPSPTCPTRYWRPLVPAPAGMRR